MTDNLILIAAVEAASAAKRAGSDPEEKIKAAMRAVQNHWMVTDKEKQFLAACEGASRHLDRPDVERMETSLKLLQALSAGASGMLDFGALLPFDDAEPLEPFPLVRWWDEIVAECVR